jgi:hypothetical protein
MGEAQRDARAADLDTPLQVRLTDRTTASRLGATTEPLVTTDGPQPGEPPPTVPGPPALWGIVVGGGLVGLAITLTTDDRGQEAWLVWAVFAAALTGTAALTGVIGWRSWDLIRWVYQGVERQKRHMLMDLSLVGVLIAALVVIGILGGSYLGELLVAVTLIGGAPAVAAMTETRRVLNEPRREGGLGSPPFDAIAELRVLLRRLLVAGGALVALSTLALGASLERSPEARGVSLDQEPSVLVFGALGSAIVGLVYVPAAAALRTRIRGEARDCLPLEEADPTGEQVLQRLRERRDLEKLLAGDQGIYDELLASIVVLGPLLTSAVQQYVVR